MENKFDAGTNLWKKMAGTIPNKSFMAVGNTIPVVGEPYHCKRLQKQGEKLLLHAVITSRVIAVKPLANNVFVVTTMNSYYVVRVLHMQVGNVHFALVKREPLVGEQLFCDKIKFIEEDPFTVRWRTSTVKEVKFIKGLYRVKTKNSIYICFPLQ